MDILCISTTDWNEIWGSRQQIMLRLANLGHRILFVERQIGPEHWLRNAFQKKIKLRFPSREQFDQISTNIWSWSPPIIPPGRYYALALNRWGQTYLARHLKPILKKIGFEHPVLWLYPPQSAPLITQFDEALVVYHCIERFIGNQRGLKRKTMWAQEKELLQRADLVFTHSQGLKNLYSPLTQQPIVLIPSAADVAFFQSCNTIHPAIQAIPHPRLVVMGTLDNRINVRLLEAIIHSRSEWHLVLIGEIRGIHANLNALLRHPNVHHLGKQPFTELPSLINGADVCLIPYVLNEMTQYINPIKVYEYLAVGKPVVSINLPEVETLGNYISLVKVSAENTKNTTAAFITSIQNALQNENAEKVALRRKVSLSHSWDQRVTQILATLNEFLEKKRFDEEN